MVTEAKVVSLVPGQRRAAEQALGRAFRDDPLTAYINPDEKGRRRRLEWFFRVALRYGKRYGHINTTDENVKGAAIWLPPGSTKTSLPGLARSGMLGAPLMFGFGGFRRFMRVFDRIEHLHDLHVPEPHWYLFILGVDTEHQGKGIGGALMRPMLAKADAAGQPCYLETMKEKNVAIYERFGFEVVVDETTADGGLRYWTMKRPPQR